eukprot:10873523-Alexandrium_andersonii.AAC.1
MAHVSLSTCSLISCADTEDSAWPVARIHSSGVCGLMLPAWCGGGRGAAPCRRWCRQPAASAPAARGTDTSGPALCLSLIHI